MIPSRQRRVVRIAVLLLVLAALGLYGGPRLLQSHRLRQAGKALRERDVPSAEAWLAAAVRHEPDSGEVHFLLARLARRQGKLDTVHDELTRAHELGIPSERIRREEWLAVAQSGQMRQAEPHLTELLLAAGDDTPEVCEAFVNGYFRSLNYGPAFPILDAWAGDYPADPLPHLFRGICFQEQRLWREAADAYGQALQRDESRDDIRVRRAFALAQAHQYDEALEQYRRSLSSSPDDVRVLLGLAECLYARGEIEPARQQFEAVLRVEPGNYDARFGIARIDSGDGAYERACAALGELIEEDGTRTDVLYAYAVSLRMTGRNEEAAERFKAVERLEKLLLRVDLLRANAIAHPQDLEARADLGAALFALGQQESGERWLLSVLDRNPRHQRARALLAGHFAETGRPELAARYREEPNASE